MHQKNSQQQASFQYMRIIQHTAVIDAIILIISSISLQFENGYREEDRCT